MKKKLKCQAIIGNLGDKDEKHYCRYCGKEEEIMCMSHEGAPAGCGVYSQWCFPKACDCKQATIAIEKSTKKLREKAEKYKKIHMLEVKTILEKNN